jgi:hypothetical protein
MPHQIDSNQERHALVHDDAVIGSPEAETIGADKLSARAK